METFAKLLDAFDNAVTTNGMNRGIESVSSWHERDEADEETPKRALLDLVSALHTELERTRRDTERLNALETALWSSDCGNGIAFMPSTNLVAGTARISLIDLGEQDGSDLADEVADGGDLRSAIDQLIALGSPDATTRRTE